MVLLDLDQNGAVTSCEVVRPSGVRSLDEATCQIAMPAQFAVNPQEAELCKNSQENLVFHFIIPHASPTSADLDIEEGNHVTILYDPRRHEAHLAAEVTGPGQARRLERRPTNRSPSYPAKALESEAEGRVFVTVDVDRNGKPEKCGVVRTSGSSGLDHATCQFAMKNLRYTPATNYHGEKIGSVDLFSLNWVIPK